MHDALNITYLVDGQVALRNQPNRRTRTSSEAAGFGSGPDLDPADVESVEIVKPLAAQRGYGTCPGVALISDHHQEQDMAPLSRQTPVTCTRVARA
jgi:hypothetical protein